MEAKHKEGQDVK